MRNLIALFFLMAVTSGCATMTRSNYQSVFIDSLPQGAEIISNKTERHTTTPTQINFEKGDDVYIELRKDGYQNHFINLERKVTPIFWLNLLELQLAPVGMMVDYTSGAMWDYKGEAFARLEAKNSDSRETSPDTPSDTSDAPDIPVQNQSREIKYTPWEQKKKNRFANSPRTGLTYLPPKTIDKIREKKHKDVSNLISQFGWEFENQISIDGSDNKVILGIMPLVGGLDQNVSIPSISGIIGYRSAGGLEVGFGPAVTSLESVMYYSLGYNKKASPSINFPVSLVLWRGKSGLQTSIMTGINW